MGILYSAYIPTFLTARACVFVVATSQAYARPPVSFVFCHRTVRTQARPKSQTGSDRPGSLPSGHLPYWAHSCSYS